jgi:insertion element IS1 protein InsB
LCFGGATFVVKPFSISKVYADGNYVYEKILGFDKVKVGKRNAQKVERKHLSLCAWVKRLARKTLCFSKSLQVHKHSLDCVLT